MILPFFVVRGQSMEPFAKEGDVVFVNTFVSVCEGDVVVLRHPTEDRLLLKRIVRKEGERYWVEGDHAAESTDSREFGSLSKKDILGRAKVIHSRTP